MLIKTAFTVMCASNVTIKSAYNSVLLIAKRAKYTVRRHVNVIYARLNSARVLWSAHKMARLLAKRNTT